MLADRKAFHAFLRPLFRKNWVVYAKRPFGGPEHVLHYLARYTHRVAISPIASDRRELCRGQSHLPLEVIMRKPKTQTTADDRACRRVPPAVPAPYSAAWFRSDPLLRLPREPQARGELFPVCRRLLQAPSPQDSAATDASASGVPCAWLCPHCGGAMVLVEKLTPQQMLRRSVGRRGASPTLHSSLSSPKRSLAPARKPIECAPGADGYPQTDRNSAR